MSDAGYSRGSNQTSAQTKPQLPICVKTDPFYAVPIPPRNSNTSAGNYGESSNVIATDFSTDLPQPHYSSAIYESLFSQHNSNDSKTKLEPREIKTKVSTSDAPNSSEKRRNEESRKRKATFHENPNDPGYEKNEKFLKFKTEKLSDDDSDDSDDEKLVKYTDWKRNITGHVCEEVFERNKSNLLTEKDYEKLPAAVISNLMESKLPSGSIKSELETDDCSFSVKNYEWEKLVDNEFVRKIDDNMKRTVDSVLLSEDKCKRILNEVVKDLDCAFHVEGIKNHWRCYGSYGYGLVCNNTKINIDYECSPLNRLSKQFRKEIWTSVCSSKNFKKVPKKQMYATHLKTSKQISVSFSKELDISRSLLMKLYFDMTPNLKYLFVYLKLLLTKFRQRNNRSEFPPYAVFWLVVFFMQQKNLLPTVINVRKAAKTKHDVSGWDCSLPEKYHCQTEPISLYSLLLGFFDYYKSFDFWNYVICPYIGRVLAVNDLEELQIPAEEFSVYLRKARNPDEFTFGRDLWNVQDPTDFSVNMVKKGGSLNEFKVMCHLLSELLPKCLTEIQRMDCFCHILPDSVYADCYNPCNFTKYATIFGHLNKICGKKANLNQNQMMAAVRNVMEVGFQLEPKSIAVSDCRKKHGTWKGFPAIDFEYCSSEKTWKSDCMKLFFLNGGAEEQIRVYLRCDLYRIEKNNVRLICTGNAGFLRFFVDHFVRMLRITLEKIIIDGIF